MDAKTHIERGGFKRVLNVGCGPAGHRHSFLNGLELSQIKVGIDVNLGRINTWHNTDWCVLQKDLAEPLPFVDDYFEVVVAFDVIEHLSYKDGMNLIRECERVLGPNGLFMIFAPEGFIDTIKYQREFVKTPWDLHQSAWYPEWFESMGYTVEYLPNAHVLDGDKFGAFFAWMWKG